MFVSSLDHNPIPQLLLRVCAVPVLFYPSFTGLRVFQHLERYVPNKVLAEQIIENYVQVNLDHLPKLMQKHVETTT